MYHGIHLAFEVMIVYNHIKFWSFKEIDIDMQNRLIYKNVKSNYHRVKKSMPLFVLIFFCAISLILPSEGDCAQATFTWDKNTETYVAGYKIYYGNSSGLYNWSIDVGNVTKYTITGLAEGSTYYFAATAYDTSKKESKHSSEVSFNSCTYTISPTTAKFESQGGTGTVKISTQKSCNWTATSGVPWITINSGNKGTGSGEVSYSVTTNSKNSSRSASFTIGHSIFTVNQAGHTQISKDASSIKEYMVKVTIKQKNKGSGVVKSYDRKIDCGDVCFSNYKQKSTVTLYATPGSGSTFIGWAPATLGCEGTGPCMVSVDKIKKIQAIFAGDYELKLVTVSKNGGAGRVTSSPWALDCKSGNDGKCDGTYRYNRDVTLTSYASPGSIFVGWRPEKLCPGTGKCTIAMDRKRIIKAVFSKPIKD